MEDDVDPLACVTRKTLAYTLSLSVWSVCFKSDDDMFKGRAATFYDKAPKDLQGLADEDWERLVKELLLQYVTMVTSPEPPGQAAQPLSAPDIVAGDAARAAAGAVAGPGPAVGGAGGGGEDNAGDAEDDTKAAEGTAAGDMEPAHAPKPSGQGAPSPKTKKGERGEAAKGRGH